MPRRAGLGCLFVAVALVLGVYALAVLPSVPWWALAFGALFWVTLVRRLRAGRSDSPAAADDDGRTPFALFRDRGGF